MTHQVQVLPAKPADLSLITRWEARMGSQRLSSDLHIHTMALTCPPAAATIDK